VDGRIEIPNHMSEADFTAKAQLALRSAGFVNQEREMLRRVWALKLPFGWDDAVAIILEYVKTPWELAFLEAYKPLVPGASQQVSMLADRPTSKKGAQP